MVLILKIHSVVQPSPLSNSRTFLSPQKETLYLLAVIPSFPSSLYSLATANLLSLSRDLPILDISYNHTMRGLLCLAFIYLFIKICIYLFILAVQGLSCGTWDLLVAERGMF